MKCKRCGADLSANHGEVVRENEDGSKERRCPKCFFPYEIAKAKKPAKPEP